MTSYMELKCVVVERSEKCHYKIYVQNKYYENRICTTNIDIKLTALQYKHKLKLILIISNG